MENTALRHVPVGTASQSRGAPPHFSRRVRAFLDRDSSSSLDRKSGAHFLAPSFSRFDSNRFFFWVFVKDTFYREKVKNMNELRDRTVRAAGCLTNEMPETDIVLMCVVPLMAPALRPADHIRLYEVQCLEMLSISPIHNI